MVDYSLPAAPRLPPPAAAPPPPERPSKIDALKAAAAPGAPVVLAIITALGAAFTTWSQTQDTARLSYETLRAASERNGVQIEACRQSQLELTTWVEELSGRLERRQVVTEKAVARKVTRAAAPPVPLPVLEPAPPAPPPPAPIAPSALPSFDGLALRDKGP